MNNEHEIDFSAVCPVARLGEWVDLEDVPLLEQDLAEATQYMRSQSWCHEILEAYCGTGVATIFYAFLFHIKPSRPEIEEFLWVVVGDIPPLYLITQTAHNPATALFEYTLVMSVWADAAIEQTSSSGLPPVSAPFTRKNGLALRRRLAFIRNYLKEYHFQELDPELQNL